MKKLNRCTMNKIKNFLVILAFLIVPIVSFGLNPNDGTPPPPPPCPTGGGGGGGDPVPGAPIEDGVPVLLGMAFIYAAYKLRQVMKKTKEPEEEVTHLL
jgi:hypothetical protein